MGWKKCRAVPVPYKECGRWVEVSVSGWKSKGFSQNHWVTQKVPGTTGLWRTPLFGWTRASCPQSLSRPAMGRDDTGAAYTIWPAPLPNTYMPCLESTDGLVWIQDGSKHVLSVRCGVGEDGSELADTGLCFALGWGLTNAVCPTRQLPLLSRSWTI